MKNIYQSAKKQSRNERGQSLVELSLTMTIALTLLVGAIDFSVGLFAHVTMRDAAQEGAVYGSIQPADTAGIKNRVIAAASDVLPLTEGEITVTYSADQHKCEGFTDGLPNTITISIVHPHPVSTPLLGAVIGTQTINLRAQITNTILSPVCP